MDIDSYTFDKAHEAYGSPGEGVRALIEASYVNNYKSKTRPLHYGDKYLMRVDSALLCINRIRESEGGKVTLFECLLTNVLEHYAGLAAEGLNLVDDWHI